MELFGALHAEPRASIEDNGRRDERDLGLWKRQLSCFQKAECNSQLPRSSKLSEPATNHGSGLEITNLKDNFWSRRDIPCIQARCNETLPEMEKSRLQKHACDADKAEPTRHPMLPIIRQPRRERLFDKPVVKRCQALDLLHRSFCSFWVIVPSGSSLDSKSKNTNMP